MADTSPLYYNNKKAFTFFRTSDKLVLIHSYTLSPRATELITWILSAYGHLLPDVGIYTPKQFADRVRDAYSERDDHNRKAISILTDMHEFAIQEAPTRLKGV